jgi:hypothetical protein
MVNVCRTIPVNGKPLNWVTLFYGWFYFIMRLNFAVGDIIEFAL